MPSRLDSLYAYADPLEALSFTEITNEPKQVWEGTVQDGVAWAVVDMSVFKVIEPEVPDEGGFEETWRQAFDAAKQYLQPIVDTGAAEVLVAGQIRLSRRLQLIPLLRELGLLAPD